MNKYIEEFEQLRDYLADTILDTVTNFWCDHEALETIYAYPLIKEITKIIQKDLDSRTTLPQHLIPKFKISIKNEDLMISIQEYFNDDKDCIFLANVSIEEKIYDLYCKKSYDSSSLDYSFMEKHGHDQTDVTEGTKTAETEYMLQLPTPLSVAYEIALNEGYI